MGWGKKKAASDRPTWNQEDYHTEFAGKLTEQIRNGTAHWQKPWKPGERRLPENLHTGNFPLGHRVAVVVAPLECQPVGLLDVKDGVAAHQRRAAWIPSQPCPRGRWPAGRRRPAAAAPSRHRTCKRAPVSPSRPCGPAHPAP